MIGLFLAAAVAGAPEPAVTRFKCEGGADLTAQFASRGQDFVAIVNTTGATHALPMKAWEGGPVKLIWTDGRRTLTWSPGVQIMWMDGATHRMCGRSGGHKH